MNEALNVAFFVVHSDWNAPSWLEGASASIAASTATRSCSAGATGLVHQVWLKLVRQHARVFENRAHFFGAASHAMRRLLVSHARAKLAPKRLAVLTLR